MRLSKTTFAAVTGLTLCIGASAGVAEAQPNIQGGGATLPAPTYRQEFNCYGSPVAPDTVVPLECVGAPYPIDPLKKFRYAGVGSGNGQCMYFSHDPVTYNTDGARPITEVNFAGSDAKLTQAQIDLYNNGGTLSSCSGTPTIPAQPPLYGPLIMIPSLATPITLAISPSTRDLLNILPLTPDGGTSGLTFSRKGYCKLLTGQITNWNSTDPDFISQNFGVDMIPQPFSANDFPLEVVYRSDNSGTTFLLTQHMTAVQAECTDTAPYSGPAEMMPAVLRGLTNWVGKSGSGMVEGEVLATMGSIGYLSPDFTAQAATGGHTAVTANLVNAAGVVLPPSPTATTAGMGGPTPPTGTDRQLPVNWVPLVPDPAASILGAYPIVGYTTLEFYTCYRQTNGVDIKSDGIRNFLGWFFNSPDGDVPDQVLGDNGFAALPSAWKSAITDTFVTGDANNLQIRVGPVAGFCSIGG